MTFSLTSSSLAHIHTLEGRLPFHLSGRQRPSTGSSDDNVNGNGNGGNPSIGGSGRSSQTTQQHSQSHNYPFTHARNASDVRPSIEHLRSQSCNDTKDAASSGKRSSMSTLSSKGNTIRSRSNSASNTSSPPRNRLQKPRPATASPSRQRVAMRPFDSVSQHAPVLPPLLTVPILSVDTDASPLTTSASPSTAVLLSAAVHATAPAYYDRDWSNSSTLPRDFSHQRGPSSRQRSDSIDLSSGFQGAGRKSGSRRLRAEAEGASGLKGHSRNHSRSTKGSGETTSSKRSSKGPSQKAMLSQALQNANTAVLLDNAENVQGAIEAYSEACALLEQVMLRSSRDEDRRKLEAIRNTYTSRISELSSISSQPQDSDENAPPARPSDDTNRVDVDTSRNIKDGSASLDTAEDTGTSEDQSDQSAWQRENALASFQIPWRRDSLLPANLSSQQSRSGNHLWQPRDRIKPPLQQISGDNLSSMVSQYLPPPLPTTQPIADQSPSNGHQRQQTLELPKPALHRRAPSNESLSWLDTIDESGGSSASSVHSRTSSTGVRRKRTRAASGATEAEFDAALDAAVQAAYGDGVQQTDNMDSRNHDHNDADEVEKLRRKVESVKKRVRESEREAAIQDSRDRERRRWLESRQGSGLLGFESSDGNESEDEERLLEEMTRGYVIDGFEFGLQSKSKIPRESDSSGFSGRTWNSSIGSNPTSSGTSLSTVTESSAAAYTRMPAYPPPSQALPQLPPARDAPTTSGVRSRRLSGRNPKTLKIETASGPTSSHGPLLPSPLLNKDLNHAQPKTAGYQVRNARTFSRPPIHQSARLPTTSFLETSQNSNPLAHNIVPETEFNGPLPRSGSPSHAHSRFAVRKTFSSSSLKNMRNRNPSVSVSNADDGVELSPTTPPSSYSNPRDGASLPAMPALPTPIATVFKERMDGQDVGGMFLFNNGIHSPPAPDSPNTLDSSPLIPLEPCPTEYALRPFWLMRAIYQTIAHPQGGYLSTKLFVPHDVWRVKSVKLKNIEEKIANCDFLTAALMKLSQVDNCDADAMLEGMQALEVILEQVQATLAKKLGSEVGAQGSSGIFKDAPLGGDGEMSATHGKTGSTGSRSSSFSWRRLRPKNSAVGLANNYSNKNVTGDGGKESLNMATLPMTSMLKTRVAKRDVSQIQFSGPNAHYMSSLARLFDAAQAIDQIARQVEDPGLRHADKTHVGLELCTRHAAEFFAFYICRFVLTDVGLLLDKFIKRGSEWVLI